MANNGSGGKTCCRCCTGFLFSMGLTALFLWLLYRPFHPRFYLTSFSLPVSGGGGNHTANFTIEVENKCHQLGIYHDSLLISLFYNTTTLLEPPAVIPAFRQGKQKTTDKSASAELSLDRRRWIDAVRNGTAVFRVAVRSAYKYRFMKWSSRHHNISVAADVEVDSGGQKTERKGIRLRSTGSQKSVRSGVVVVWICLCWLLVVV